MQLGRYRSDDSTFDRVEANKARNYQVVRLAEEILELSTTGTPSQI